MTPAPNCIDCEKKDSCEGWNEVQQAICILESSAEANQSIIKETGNRIAIRCKKWGQNLETIIACTPESPTVVMRSVAHVVYTMVGDCPQCHDPVHTEVIGVRGIKESGIEYKYACCICGHEDWTSEVRWEK